MAPAKTFPGSRLGLQTLLGWLAVFASAFCFYLATASIRWAQPKVDISPAYFAFFRFFLGYGAVCLLLLIKRQALAPRRYDLLIGRTLFNCLAVYCFYTSVAVTSLAEGNLLNMTYPIFLAILSWILLKEQRDVPALFMVLVAFIGIWLILSPGKIEPRLENAWGLGSGFFAAFSILCLNISRRYHDSETILYYMFGLGTILMYALFHEHIFWPNQQEFWYLMLCGLFGITGQYLLTLGFLYVTAVEGGIISSFRILLAAVLGQHIANDPALGLAGWLGALLLFLANVVLALRKSKRLPDPAAALTPADGSG